MQLNSSRALAWLLTVAFVVPSTATCRPANESGPAPAATTATGPSAGEGSMAAPSGSLAAAGASDATRAWLPEWADASVPEEVANRRPLHFCGIERPPAPQPGLFVDRIVRLCFWDAAQHGQEAEWVSVQSTMEGGTIATVYRVLRDGTVEVLMDATQDRFGAGTWVRSTCRAVVEAEGDELVGVDGCDEGEFLR